MGRPLTSTVSQPARGAEPVVPVPRPAEAVAVGPDLGVLGADELVAVGPEVEVLGPDELVDGIVVAADAPA